MDKIFKAYDIRGKYPEEINEQIARKIGFAFVKFLNAKSIVVGYDARLSSPSLAKSFVQGAIYAGAEVVNIGLASTPMLYYAIWHNNFDGGVIVTASHLPGHSNGFKLCKEKAIPLSSDYGIQEIKNIVKELDDLPDIDICNCVKKYSILEDYIDTLSMFVIKPIPLKIAVDAGNGAMGPEVIKLFSQLSLWKLVPLYLEPDGNFPNHVANPFLPDTTKDLQELVVKEKADFGVAFDGDGDRIGVIDDKGNRISNDIINSLLCDLFLYREPSATIVYDLRSSRIVKETITKLGGIPISSRVGHAFIKTLMREKNAIFGGELSGHYYFRDMGFTDNAIFAMIQICNLLALKKQPLSVLTENFKKYFNTGEISLKIKDKDKILSELENYYKDANIDKREGLTIEYADWWSNIRASNTEDYLRVNIEANNYELLEIKKLEILNLIKKIDPLSDIV